VGPQRSWSGVNVSTVEQSCGFEFGIADFWPDRASDSDP
jgi:hypothetical protein